MPILITVLALGGVMLLVWASYALFKGAGPSNAIVRGAIMVAMWVLAIGAGAAGVAWALGDDDDDATSATSNGTPTAGPAQYRATLSGTLTLDGAPLDASALGVRVERDGFVAACQARIPDVTSGTYEIEILSDDEAPGCGADGAEVLLWAYVDDTLFAGQTTAWPGDGGAAEFDGAFSSADPEGASTPVTAVYGLVTDASGDSPRIGTPVEVYVGDTLCGVSAIRRYGDEDGFLIFASGPDEVAGCTEGAPLSFVVGGVTANETIVHNFDAGEDGDALELTVDETFARS